MIRGSNHGGGWGGVGSFLLYIMFRPALGPTQPPLHWVPGALSLGVKRLRREADHSHPSSADVKNAWSYTSIPQYVFMAWCLVKHRDNFTFYTWLWDKPENIKHSKSVNDFVRTSQKSRTRLVDQNPGCAFVWMCASVFLFVLRVSLSIAQENWQRSLPALSSVPYSSRRHHSSA
jgi:hypothetical protein